MNMAPIPRIYHMSLLNFVMNVYFIEYINYVVIHDTKKSINSAMNFSEYFFVIGCRLIMACYVGHSVREYF